LKSNDAGQMALVVDYLGRDDRVQRRLRRAGRVQEAHLRALRRITAGNAGPLAAPTGAR
jgi:hypothetical protein